ncbi:MAG: recombinase family protein [Planctomycetota bacterium]
MKVVAYARVSYLEQEEGGFPSLEEQTRRLEAFASHTGLALEKVHTDHGLTPTQDTRAGLVNILDDMEESDWEAVLIVSGCRLRGLCSTLTFDPVEELRNAGKRVLVANDDTARQLRAIVEDYKARQPKKVAARKSDEVERKREIAQRLLKGREEGARQGKHQSGPAPYGYRRDYDKRSSEGVMLVPDEVEAEVVKLIFREYLRLRSMKRLIKLLDEQGLRTRRSKQWSRAGVSWILKNDTYIGRVHFGDIHVKGRHEPIVAPITFNKAQQLIKANNKRSREGGKKGDDDEDELEDLELEAATGEAEDQQPAATEPPAKPAPAKPAPVEQPAAKARDTRSRHQSLAASSVG